MAGLFFSASPELNVSFSERHQLAIFFFGTWCVAFGGRRYYLTIASHLFGVVPRAQ